MRDFDYSKVWAETERRCRRQYKSKNGLSAAKWNSIWIKVRDELYPNAGIAEEGRCCQVRAKCPFVKN